MINNYNTPLYVINHQKVVKPQVTERMKKDFARFLNKL